MIYVAMRMLLGDRAKYFGLVFGLTFASLVLTQQSSVFLGLMTRTFGAITDTGIAEIWVMDPKVQFIDDIKPMSDTALLRVRGVEGVDWAVPLYKSLLKARLENGNFQSVNVFGLDDATLAGCPHTMVEGDVDDLRRSDAVIIDAVGARGKLAKPSAVPGGPSTPLHVGDALELNDHRAVVVGICQVSRTFQSQPVVYTSYTRATAFAPRERKMLSFIIARPKPGADAQQVCRNIEEATGLTALTSVGFRDKTTGYFMKYTGIPINFGTAVVLGFLVGLAIVGQLFYAFTLDNLRYFATLKAMGTSNARLLRMILVQSLFVGATGYGLGVGFASLFGYAFTDTELAFRLPWQLLVGSAAGVLTICAFSSIISLRKVVKLEPAVVFK